MDYALGVDLGTTYTAAAVRLDGRAQIVRLGSRRAEIPSLVFVREDGVVLVGDAAERRGADEPVRLAREFKRRLGDPVPVLVGGSPYSAHALMARVLEHVYQTVLRQNEGPPSVVCVTHPANWGPYKRELLMQAVQMADVPDVQLRPEPEAAAVQYAAQERVKPGEIVAVYDLGGGTFDAAVLRKTETGFELLGEPAGIEQLGGVDFDEAVLNHVMEVLGERVDGLDPEQPAVREALTKLRRDCVTAKEDLSEDTEVLIPVALPALHTRVRLNRSEFEAMIGPVLAETTQALRRALRSAGVSATDLRSILLAGGSSRIPLVSELLSTQFEKPLALDGDPAHNVALGAALSAGLASSPRRATTARMPVAAPPTPPPATPMGAMPAPATHTPPHAPPTPAPPTPMPAPATHMTTASMPTVQMGATPAPTAPPPVVPVPATHVPATPLPAPPTPRVPPPPVPMVPGPTTPARAPMNQAPAMAPVVKVETAPAAASTAKVAPPAPMGAAPPRGTAPGVPVQAPGGPPLPPPPFVPGGRTTPGVRRRYHRLVTRRRSGAAPAGRSLSSPPPSRCSSSSPSRGC
ncbi:Hsp70 family protein [Phytohabitans flavus]|uniref:Hsp70 family protein n=1 Tax=Phytohabitans flavus TaxID=1076124 RepID=UPI00362F87BE